MREIFMNDVNLVDAEKKLKEYLKEYDDIEDKEIEVNVMFVDSNIKRNKKFKGYMLKISKNDIITVINSSLENIKNDMEKKRLSSYDLEVTSDDIVEIINKSSVSYSDNILDQINLELDGENTINKDTKFRNLDFIVIQVFFKNKSIYLFNKYTHPEKSFKKSFMLTFNSEMPRLIKSEIFSINSCVAAMLIENNYYIFDRKNFHSIFKFKDGYKTIVNNKKNEIINYNIFSDDKAFIEDCLNDGRYLPRLTKIVMLDGFETIHNNKKNIDSVIKKHKLKLELDDKGSIKYNKSYINEILNLLLNYYVTTSLTNEEMIAKSFESIR
jgi:hypothetical protein